VQDEKEDSDFPSVIWPYWQSSRSWAYSSFTPHFQSTTTRHRRADRMRAPPRLPQLPKETSRALKKIPSPGGVYILTLLFPGE
jgi:hypothetical protein